MAQPLDALRTWLVRENTTVMAVLLLVIGVVMIGKGAAASRRDSPRLVTQQG